MKTTTKYFLLTLIPSLLFCIAISFDISPLLRGPAPYPPEWQWPYLFINTLSRIYLPLILITIIVTTFLLKENKKNFLKNTPLFLLSLILLHFLFQFSILYFSRSGIPVIIHRIIEPTLNGYFTASLPIQNIPDFLHTYNQNILNFVYHAKSHPPGAILIFHLIKQIITPFPTLINFISSLNPTHSDVLNIWNTLSPIHKATAVASGFIIPFLSSLAIIPLFLSTQIIAGTKTAIRSVFLYFFIPTILFFIPINDSFLQLFSITAFFLFLKGLQKNKNLFFFLSGLALALGVFFNLSILPLTLFFFTFFLLKFLQNKKKLFTQYLKHGITFLLGFLTLPLSLFLLFQFNFLEMITIIMKHVPDIHSRSYPLWLYYNLQDFLIFCGIPITIVLITQTKNTITYLLQKSWKKIDPVFLSLLLMILILNFSGSVRGETGRLWSPYIPFAIIATTIFLTKMKFSSKLFAGFLLLQAIQILIMQEFWVLLW